MVRYSRTLPLSPPHPPTSKTEETSCVPRPATALNDRSCQIYVRSVRSRWGCSSPHDCHREGMELAVIELPDQVVEALVTQVLAAIESRHAQAAGNWLSIEEAADYVRTTPDALRKAVQRGQVPAHQPLGPGTRYLFSRAELDQWAVSR